jgi:hypothetical protein
MDDPFELLLFTTNPQLIRDAVAAGIDGFIVDWERQGKERRQNGNDTEINRDTVEDLRVVRACCEDALVICRINGNGFTRNEEIEQALAAGADELLLPMVTTVEEVELVLDVIAGRGRLGILVETCEAVSLAKQLARLPLSRVYVGLNDLSIQRGDPNIFTAVSDGTVERALEPFQVPVGFGGLTLPERGAPIPCRLLMGEMMRLGCHFSFLRRSFRRDVQDRNLSTAVTRIRQYLEQTRHRSPEVVRQERRELHRAIRAWNPPRTAITPNELL